MTVALCAVAGSSTPSSASTITSPPTVTLVSGPTVAGELDFRQVTLRQSTGSVVWSFSTTRNFMISQFGSGRMACLEISPRGDPGKAQKLCVVNRGGPRALFRIPLAHGGPRPRFIPAVITRSNDHSARIVFAQSTAGLGRGRWDFRATSVWTGTAACPASAPCTDAVPHGGTAAWRIDRYAPAGCIARGPSEVFSGRSAGRMIALTFDDGPSAYTRRVLALLGRYHAHATFFEIGRQVASDPAASRAVVAAHDAIGDHTWSHPVLTQRNVRSQVEDARSEIAAQTGYTPCLVRPPYGVAPPAVVTDIRNMGMLTLQWDVDPRDWSLPGARTIASRVLRNVHPGAIVILHDGGGPRDQTIAALGTIIPALQNRGYHLVTVPQLLGLATIWRYSH